MSQLLAQLQLDLNASRKAGDKPATLLLGTIISDVKNREIELKRPVTDEDAVDVLRCGIKKRREAIDMYQKGNRPELAATESAEVAVLERYLPAAPSAEVIRAAVQSGDRVWCVERRRGHGHRHAGVQGARRGRNDQRRCS